MSKEEVIETPIEVPVKEVQPTIATLKGIKVKRVLLKEAFTIPQGGTETTISEARTPGIEMLYTAMGLTVKNKGAYVIVPLANVIVAYE